MLVRELPFVSMTTGVPTTVYPAVWFEVTTELPGDLAAQLRFLQWVPRLGDIIGYTSIAIGILTAVLGAILIRGPSCYSLIVKV